MLEDIFKFFDNENLYVFFAVIIFVALTACKTFSLVNIKYEGKNVFIRNGITELIFGFIIAILFSLLGFISPPITFYHKKIYFNKNCNELPGCIEKKGIFYISDVTIQYSTDPGFYRLIYQYKDEKTKESLQADIIYNKKFIFGWEEKNV